MKACIASKCNYIDVTGETYVSKCIHEVILFSFFSLFHLGDI